jgi:hypothetical protein
LSQDNVPAMPPLSIGSSLHHDSHDLMTSYPALQQHPSAKFVPPNFAAAVSAVSAAAAAQALSSSHKSAFVPTSHQLSLYR